MYVMRRPELSLKTGMPLPKDIYALILLLFFFLDF